MRLKVEIFVWWSGMGTSSLLCLALLDLQWCTWTCSSTQQCLHRLEMHTMHQCWYHGNSARKLRISVHLSTHTGDGYDSSMASWKLCREGKDWWKIGSSQAKSVEWEFKEKCWLWIIKEKEKVFSKVGPVKNAEKWHNFGLIMVVFLVQNKLLWYFVFGFWQCKGLHFWHYYRNEINLELHVVFGSLVLKANGPI